jgi:hypothetical protein
MVGSGIVASSAVHSSLDLLDLSTGRQGQDHSCESQDSGDDGYPRPDDENPEGSTASRLPARTPFEPADSFLQCHVASLPLSDPRLERTSLRIVASSAPIPREGREHSRLRRTHGGSCSNDLWQTRWSVATIYQNSENRAQPFPARTAPSRSGPFAT